MDASYVLVDDENKSFSIPKPVEQQTDTQPPASPLKEPETISTPSPPPILSYAHDWRTSTTGGLRINGRHFVDKHGRVCNLRGVNFSGACKTPTNDDNAIFPDRHEHVTFVGRPFPLEEAPQHLARLRRWGLTFIRFLVTWEAIEHTGPGEYDYEYLEYVRQLLALLPEYGIAAFVELHQDVWSRYTGGSGAPAWTITAVGLDIHKIEDAGAAWLKGVKGGGHIEEERGLWPCGYQKLAAATVATCFWAGDVFAPKLKVDGVPIQKYLQDRYLASWELLAKTVGALEGVIGFQMMNEPHRGYIDVPSMHSFDYNTDLHLAHVPSPLQSFALGAGHAQNVPHYTRSFPLPTKLTSYELLNEEGINVWRDDGPTNGQCLWELHGVWGWDTRKEEAIALRESYFVKNPMTDVKIDWYDDFYFPFMKRWSERVQAVSSSDKLIFAEPIPNEFAPASWTAQKRPSNFVFAPHWYCLNSLFQKAFGNFSVNVQGLSRGMFPLKAFYWGHHGVRENFSVQIKNIAEKAYEALGEVPIVIGECGVPMDMNHGEAFRTNNFAWQSKMMDAMITGLEHSLVGFTLWNYNPDNDDLRGDYWNGENFSWFSRNRAHVKPSLEQTSSTLDEGGRILRAVVRPYAAKTAGIPKRFDYEMNTGRFEYEWSVPPKEEFQLTSNETEIFIPAMLAQGRRVLVDGLRPDDSYSYDISRQTLEIKTGNEFPVRRVKVAVYFDPPLTPEFEVNTFGRDFGLWIGSFVALLLALSAWMLL